ncbi:MAG: hypothetical protein RR311_01835 [Comamonas sp.]
MRARDACHVPVQAPDPLACLGTTPGKKAGRAGLNCTGNGRSGRVFKNDYPTLFFSLAAGACAADTETHIFFDLD